MHAILSESISPKHIYDQTTGHLLYINIKPFPVVLIEIFSPLPRILKYTKDTF